MFYYLYFLFLYFILVAYFFYYVIHIQFYLSFLDKLSYLITDQELDLRRLYNGVRSRRLRTRARKELDSKILNAQDNLVNQRYHFIILYNLHIMYTD